MSTITVLGAGVIGSGWAARALAHGHSVSVWDPDPAAFERSAAAVARAWPHMRARGLTALPLRAATYHADLAPACAATDWVQEAAPERLDVKRQLYASVEPLIAATTPIVSSSSGLLPSQLQAGMQHPERFCVGHPFNPVYLLPLVEVVPGAQTDAATRTAVQTFLAELGMQVLLVRKEIEGYLSDRLQEALWREALHLVNDGVATTGELDAAVRHGPGLRWAIMGTCLTFHLAGGTGGMRHMLEQFGPALELPWTSLKAPQLTGELIEAMVDGTRRQAAGRSVADLEALRDDCLVDIMRALDRYEQRLQEGV